MKKALYENWLRTHNREDRRAYACMNREVKREIILAKNALWENKCEEIDRKMGDNGVSQA